MWKSRRKSSRSNILKLIYDARIIRWRHNAVSSITLFVSLVLRWVPCYPGNCAWIHVCSWGKRYANMLDEAHGRPIGYITRCTQRIVVSSLFFCCLSGCRASLIILRFGDRDRKRRTISLFPLFYRDISRSSINYTGREKYKEMQGISPLSVAQFSFPVPFWSGIYIYCHCTESTTHPMKHEPKEEEKKEERKQEKRRRCGDMRLAFAP